MKNQGHKIKYFLLLLFYVATGNAQISDKEKSNIYFKEAQKYFDLKEYETALFFINKIEDSLNVSNATLLDLKIRTYFALDRFGLAKKALNTYVRKYYGNAPKSIEKDTLSYLALIEKGIKDSIRISARINAKREAEAAIAYRVQKAIEAFRLEKCSRCKGEGKYSLTKLYYGRKPWWTKERFNTCEVCKGQGTYLAYPENDTIMGLPEEEFIKAHKEEILKHILEKKNSE